MYAEGYFYIINKRLSKDKKSDKQKEKERIDALFEYKNWTPEKLKEKIELRKARNTGCD